MAFGDHLIYITSLQAFGYQLRLIPNYYYTFKKGFELDVLIILQSSATSFFCRFLEDWLNFLAFKKCQFG
jgi:hypothetical protein